MADCFLFISVNLRSMTDATGFHVTGRFFAV
jgi:hypothetical protein